ncbi:MAG: lipoate--protein ligase family protein [Planctomycetes bacterium]|nr:lipoate--protein ligase family protein [Planctomycetota bacterium]
MSRLPVCRILIDPKPNSGSWNMAVDEVLLETAVNEGVSAVRVYEWSEATVSLGYFQDAEAADRNPEFAKLPKVRRLSGGGAILHHHELTYSLVLPATHPLAGEPHRLYENVHDRILTVLKRFGIYAQLRGTDFNENDEPFLCFGRKDPRDIIYRGHKILGSAQRRRRGAVLQHGSLLLKRSAYSPAFPGIDDLYGEHHCDGRLASELAAALGVSIGNNCVDFSISDIDRMRITQLQNQRYSSLHWNRLRQAPSRPEAQTSSCTYTDGNRKM